jgi:hypothetical protein
MLFGFNLYSSLLLSAFIQGILFAILLIYRGYKENRLSDNTPQTFGAALLVVCVCCCKIYSSTPLRA